jgi:hypothetical protein
MKAQVFGESLETTTQALPFQPPTPTFDPTLCVAMASPVSRTFTIRSRKLHPDYSPNEGFRHKLKNALTSSDPILFAKWRLGAQMPRTLIVGAPLPVKLSFEHLESSSVLLDIPPVYVRRAWIKL